jgi:hypothetical protein
MPKVSIVRWNLKEGKGKFPVGGGAQIIYANGEF